MTGGGTDILIFVEDPGAANMVVGLTAALAARGLTGTVVADGAAGPFLTDRGEPTEAVPNGAGAEALLDRHAPKVLATGTSEDPDTFAFALIRAARDRGLPTLSLVDGPVNAAIRFRGRTDAPLAHVPNHLLVADPLTARAYEDLGLAAGRVTVVGNPAYDRVRSQRAALGAQGRAAVRRACFPDLPADQPLLLFLAELSDGLDGRQFRRNADYTLAGRGGADGRTEVVLEEVLDAARALAVSPLVAVRLHPKTPRALYTAYEPEIAAFSQGGAPYPALFAADVVVGLTTVLLAEATVLGRPVLSVVPRAEEAGWLAANDLGWTPWVADRIALRDALARALADPDGFMPTPADGTLLFDAAGRIAGRIAELTREEQES